MDTELHELEPGHPSPAAGTPAALPRVVAVAIAVVLIAGLGALATHEGDGRDRSVAADSAGSVTTVLDTTTTSTSEPASTTTQAPATTSPPASVATVSPATTTAVRAPASPAPAAGAPSAPAPSGKLVGSGLYVVQPDGGGLRLVVPGIPHFPSFSPDGKRLLYMRDNQVRVIGVDGAGDRVIGASTFRPRWSPDGREVAYIENGTLWVVDVDGGSMRQVTGGGLRDVDWSRDGTRFAVVAENSLDVLSADGSGRRTIAGSAGWDGGIAWSPDGTRIGYLNFDKGPSVVEVETGNVVPLVGVRNMAWPMSWAPDSRSVAFVNYENMTSNDIAVGQADGSGVRTVIAGGVAPSFSPDGSRIAYMTYRDPGAGGRLVTELHVVGADGSGNRRLTTNSRTGAADAPAWSPDGSLIVFAYNKG